MKIKQRERDEKNDPKDSFEGAGETWPKQKEKKRRTASNQARAWTDKKSKRAEELEEKVTASGRMK